MRASGLAGFMQQGSWLDWVLDPDRVLGWLLIEMGQVLPLIPMPLFFLGYIVAAIALTRWVVRRVVPMPIDPRHPLFRQPGGERLWVGTSLVRGLLVLGVAVIGFALPDALADTIWHAPYSMGELRIGIMGRLAEIAGVGCGLIIGLVAQAQLAALFLLGMIGWAGWQLLQWIITG
jgi:hypothetical protein